jgi:hypothetical protein
MNRSMMIALGVVSILALVLALTLVDQSGDNSGAGEGGPLLPELAEQVNAIDSLEIVAPSGETVASLHRSRERWRMRQKHDYEADFARIHDLLRDLSTARRIEAKTARPEWYGRLGVAAPGEGEGAGTLVRFTATDLPDVIVGRTDPAQIGRYMRLAGEPRSWLVDQDFELPVAPIEWLERAIMDIPAGDISEVKVQRADAPTVVLKPADDEGSTWVLLDAPADREVKPAWRLRQIASALARLNLEDVRPADTQAVPNDAVETEFRTRDGMVFTVRSFSDDQGNWVRFHVAEAGEGEAGETATEPDSRTIDVVAIDGRLSPWQFAIDDERFERLRPRLEELLVADEESAGEE